MGLNRLYYGKKKVYTFLEKSNSEDCNCDAAYQEGYDNGYAEGVNNADCSSVYQEGYDKGREDGYVDGQTEGYKMGYRVGNAEGFTAGKTLGQDMQKAKLTTLTVTENGIYETEDGYNEVTVNVPQSTENFVIKTACGWFNNDLQREEYRLKINNANIPSGRNLIVDCEYSTSINDMFYATHYGDGIGPKLINTSNVTYMGSVFFGSNMTKIGGIDDTSNVTYMENMFSYCRNLTTLPMLNLSSAIYLSFMFDSCSSLTNLGGFTGLKANLDLSASELITRESMINVFENAAVVEGKSITISQSVANRLTDVDMTVAVNKGWVININ